MISPNRQMTYLFRMDDSSQYNSGTDIRLSADQLQPHANGLSQHLLPTRVLAAYMVTHALSNQLARLFAKRNGNVCGPELRLILMLPALLLSPLALALFGW